MDTETVGVEWVVARPEKRNYLSHLAPTSGQPGWATRSVKALCGWVGLAGGTYADADSHTDRFGFRVRRRHCGRCVTAANHRALEIPRSE